LRIALITFKHRRRHPLRLCAQAQAAARIEALEKVLDKHIMAFDEPLSFARLSREQLQQIQEREKDLRVTLVVYDD
jgi:hypothetical protein